MSSLRLGLDMQIYQGQKMILAPRMIQSMEILQLPLVDLQARLERELLENPFLELQERLGDRPAVAAEADSPPSLDYDESGVAEFERLEQLNREWDDYFNEEHVVSRAAREEAAERKLDVMANVPARTPSLQEHLASQIAELDLPERRRQLALHICSYIDRTGYLGTRVPIRGGEGKNGTTADAGTEIFRTVSLEEIAASFGEPVSAAEVEDTLVNVVQKLDPPGIGARSVAECLLLQLTPDMPHAELLERLIRHHLEDIAHNRLPHIQKALHVELPVLQAAIETLRHQFDPKPGLQFADSGPQYVTPDVIVERTDSGEYVVRLVEDWLPPVRLSRNAIALLKQPGLDPQTRTALRRKLQAADWLVKAIEQRRQTLLKVTQAIIDRQRAFLEHGPEHIQPLKMQQIADQVGVHVTTVSRAVDDKWVQTPRGLFPLRRFFGGGKANEQTGEDVAYEVIKQKLLELVAEEDKANPLSDEELVARLNAAGYPVKRRTVTKYRQLLKIPSSRQRKDWSRVASGANSAASPSPSLPSRATPAASDSQLPPSAASPTASGSQPPGSEAKLVVSGVPSLESEAKLVVSGSHSPVWGHAQPASYPDAVRDSDSGPSV